MICIDLVFDIIVYLFEFKMPYYSFVFSVILFVEVIFVICFIAVSLVIFNREKLSNYKAVKQTCKKFSTWCKTHNVKFKNIPCFLVIGTEGSGKSTLLQKARYNLLDSTSHDKINLKKWVSRSSMAISIDDSYIGNSYNNIKSSVLEIFLELCRKGMIIQ